MPELVTVLAAFFMYGVLMFGTGWFLCSMQQQRRAEIAADRARDRELERARSERSGSL